eukprot:scaffold373488_cov16-Prasinocladus_malaysianus.AAC.1
MGQYQCTDAMILYSPMTIVVHQAGNGHANPMQERGKRYCTGRNISITSVRAEIMAMTIKCP